MRDLVNSTITTYLTVTNNRLNEIMKVLTVSPTFMPLSFLAGVSGMNFRHMPVGLGVGLLLPGWHSSPSPPPCSPSSAAGVGCKRRRIAANPDQCWTTQRPNLTRL